MNIPLIAEETASADQRCGSDPLPRSSDRQVGASAPAVAAILLLCLAACSGSDFARLGSDFADHVARETFGIDTRDLEANGERGARLREFAKRTDTLTATDAWAESRHAATAACAETRCVWTDADGVKLAEREISDLFPADETGGGLASGTIRSNVVGFTYRVSFESPTSEGFWMRHSVFGFTKEPGWPPNGRMAYFGFAGGDKTGSRPSASATWTGKMRGVAIEGTGAGTDLLGDSSLAWSVAEPGSVDLMIRNISVKTTGDAWFAGSFRFDDVPLNASGSFESGTSGNRVRGGFNGPNHEEAAGVFETRGMVGSFGARRQ